MLRTLSSFSLLIPSLILLLSCGSPQDNQLSDNEESNQIKVLVSRSKEGPGYQISSSAAGDIKTFTLCTPTNGEADCAPNVAGFKILALKDGVGPRKIFTSADSYNQEAEILLQATGENNLPLKRRFQIVKRELPTGQWNWKAVLMAADQSNQGQWIRAFDNARESLKAYLLAGGVLSANIRELSLKPAKQINGVKPASVKNLADSLAEVRPTTPQDACFLHMTSHGSQSGFAVGSQLLAPMHLDKMLTDICGNVPTVVLISACYSGVYLKPEFNMRKANRIVLTAAAANKTSFGCGAENEFTYWDGCLIENFQTSRTFTELSNNIKACIVKKERDGATSDPQAWIGEQVKHLPVPRQIGI